MAELAEITGTEPLGPGESAAVDPVAVRWAMDASIRLAVLDGRDLSRIEDALEGKPFVGTLVKVD